MKNWDANHLRYERNPEAIYAESFAIVRRQARLTHLPDDIAAIAVRLAHAVGMVEIADYLVFSNQICAVARTALAAGAPILCDCEMVRSGVIRRVLPADNPLIVTLNDHGVAEHAKSIGNTRSAAAVEAWEPHCHGSVVTIGNAPTALFHLLELIDKGFPKPAAILGFPVGFVGAAQSKAALAAHSRGVEFITLRGRRGGSALASAAVNALCIGMKNA
jgi:precorrin-8X/cobalt-precorrin-8 methylmutase